MLNQFVDFIIMFLGLLSMGILFGFSLIGIEFTYKFLRYNSFETKRWKYIRVRKDNA